MNASTITCPKCQHAFEPSAAMASQITQEVRRSLEAENNAKTAVLDAREAEIRKKSAEMTKARLGMDEELQTRLTAERTTLLASVSKQAKADASVEIEFFKQQLADNNAKLATAKARELEIERKALELEQQKADLDKKKVEWAKQETARIRTEVQAAEAVKNAAAIEAMTAEMDKAKSGMAKAEQMELEARKAKWEAEETKRTLELEKQRAIDAERSSIKAAAKQESDERYRLDALEKDKKISDLAGMIEDMKRKAEQKSQQLQGEVLELDFEASLRTAFPRDIIEPVAKGTFGGDVVHKVTDAMGRVAGTILWESKRTKNWSGSWTNKLKGDQREAKAEIAAMISLVLPEGVSGFDCYEGVWVSNPACALPMARALRHGLLEVAGARAAGEGQQSKMALVYQYLTGSAFRQRIEAIKEAFESMAEDLEAEKKAITKQWSKRETQIGMVIDSTLGLYGDLQGIAGKSMPEIEGFEFKSLGSD